jgi:GNAT superfamily N-acetyltransferase
MKIQPATTDGEILACFPVFRVLRPHLIEADFVARVRRQESTGYRLIFIGDAQSVGAAAGYRVMEFLAWGRVLYVDDLITLPERRGAGLGGALMDWLIGRAREEGCDGLHLDSGYLRKDAHRLYLNKGLALSCHHFSVELRAAAGSA